MILDTSMLCVWLNVPQCNTCGPANDSWNRKRLKKHVDREVKAGATCVLPIASIFETANHIACASSRRYEVAGELSNLLIAALAPESPWVAFQTQEQLWKREALEALATKWPPLAAQGISLADATIAEIAQYYHAAGFPVEILTGDQGLKALEPVALSPARRNRHHRA